MTIAGAVEAFFVVVLVVGLEVVVVLSKNMPLKCNFLLRVVIRVLRLSWLWDGKAVVGSESSGLLA